MAVFSFVAVARNIIVDMLQGNLRALEDQFGAFTTEYALITAMREELTSTDGSGNL